MSNLKAQIDKTARYYGEQARKSDKRAGFAMSSSEITEYAHEKFLDNFPEASASKYRAHFAAVLRAQYSGVSPRAPKAKSKGKSAPVSRSRVRQPTKRVASMPAKPKSRFRAFLHGLFGRKS